MPELTDGTTEGLHADKRPDPESVKKGYVLCWGRLVHTMFRHQEVLHPSEGKLISKRV